MLTVPDARLSVRASAYSLRITLSDLTHRTANTSLEFSRKKACSAQSTPKARGILRGPEHLCIQTVISLRAGTSSPSWLARMPCTRSRRSQAPHELEECCPAEDNQDFTDCSLHADGSNKCFSSIIGNRCIFKALSITAIHLEYMETPDLHSEGMKRFSILTT